MSRLLVMDIETTGVSAEEGERVIEAGVIEVIDGVITNNHFHAYFNPEHRIDPRATNIHGYTNEFVNEFPTFKDGGRDLFEFIDGNELIVFYEEFDLSFINCEIAKAFPEERRLEERCEIEDCLKLAKKKHPGKKCSVGALTKRYEIDGAAYKDYKPCLHSAALIALVYLEITKNSSGENI